MSLWGDVNFHQNRDKVKSLTQISHSTIVSVYFLYVVELLLAFNFYEEFEDTKGV
jgi:hypothetical protein